MTKWLLAGTDVVVVVGFVRSGENREGYCYASIMVHALVSMLLLITSP